MKINKTKQKETDELSKQQNEIAKLICVLPGILSNAPRCCVFSAEQKKFYFYASHNYNHRKAELSL